MLRYRDFPLIAGVCITAYFLILVWPGLAMHFAPDDMQNAYTYWKPGVWAVVRANLLFATSFYRPMGGLFYLPMLALFGFHPLPYRIVILILVCINVGLLYGLARRITNSRETAPFAVLLGCFHCQVMAVYASNAMIYEVLCFTFLSAAMLYYARSRQGGRVLSGRELLLVAVLFVCALNSKEMAVVFPAMLAVYEVLYFGWRIPKLRELLPLFLTGCMSLAYVIGKLFGADTLTRVEAYRPVYTPGRFLLTSGTYASQLLLVDHPLSAVGAVLFWVVLFGLAALLRRRNMWFGAAFAFLSHLPLNFVPPRLGFVLYIPLIGFAIYGADLISALLERVRPRQYRQQVAAIAFVVCVVGLTYVHSSRSEQETASMFGAQEATWKVIQEFERLHPRVQPRSKVLLVDSLIENDWDIYFIAKLYFGDRSLRAAWMRSKDGIAYGDAQQNFDHELRFEGNKLVQVK